MPRHLPPDSLIGSHPHQTFKTGKPSQSAPQPLGLGHLQAICHLFTPGNEIVQSWWGREWIRSFERIKDFRSRLLAGVSFVRNQGVIDLRISRGEISAVVIGSWRFQVKIHIAPIVAGQWEKIIRRTSGGIHLVGEVLEGTFSPHVKRILIDPCTGLFPEVRSVRFSCSCPDAQAMCRHAAAALWAAAVRFDEKPETFFELRGVDPLELIDSASPTPIPSSTVVSSSSLQEVAKRVPGLFDVAPAPARREVQESIWIEVPRRPVEEPSDDDMPVVPVAPQRAPKVPAKVTITNKVPVVVPHKPVTKKGSKSPARKLSVIEEFELAVSGQVTSVPESSISSNPSQTRRDVEKAVPAAAATTSTAKSGKATISKMTNAAKTSTKAEKKSTTKTTTTQPVAKKSGKAVTKAKPAAAKSGKAVVNVIAKTGKAAEKSAAKATRPAAAKPGKAVAKAASPVKPSSSGKSGKTGVAGKAGKTATKTVKPDSAKKSTVSTKGKAAPAKKAAPAAIKASAKPAVKKTEPAAKAKKARLTESRGSASSKGKSARKPGTKVPAQKPANQPLPKLISASDLRDRGVTYPQIRTALLNGHLALSYERGTYRTTRTTADWLERCERGEHE